MDENIVYYEPLDYTFQNPPTSNNTKLWNPNGFIVISLLFSFLPAAILYSMNYGRLGDTKKRNIILAVAFSAFVFAITLGFLIDSPITKPLLYGLNIGLGMYMHSTQKDAYSMHLINGGKKASYIIPITVCLLATILIVYISVKTSANIPAQMKQFCDDELYYTDNVTLDEVNKLGNYLEKVSAFGYDEHAISVKLDKKSDVYIFSMVIDKNYFNDEEYLNNIKPFAQSLSSNLFNNSQVEIDVCDNRFNPIKAIKAYS